MDYVWFKFTFCQPGITGTNNVPSPGFYNIKLKKKDVSCKYSLAPVTGQSCPRWATNQ